MNDVPAGVLQAPQWALLAGEIGRGSIWVAIIAFLLGALLYGFLPFLSKVPRSETGARFCFAIGCLSLLTAFGCLTSLFVGNQFEYQYVFEHGDSNTDLKYKLAGVWTAQEGSFLLWACTSALFGLLSVRGTGIYRRWYTVAYGGFLSVLSAILAYETPFGLLKQALAHGHYFVFPRGAGMTPALQNYWVVIHPPTIFTGFGSLTVFFAYAVSALLVGNAKDWVAKVRPWALLTISILGLGICMGGLWAYETQGWGGFWAWDPVENASFVPWLFTVVLAHGLLVQASRGKWAGSNLFLGALPFISFVYGTFLTRSGLLDNVSNHSFANMDASALVILRWFMIAFTAGFIGLFSFRVKRAMTLIPKVEEEPNGAHRESFYRFGMLLISLFAVVVTLGMSWPVIETMRRGEGSKVEEWLYHQVGVWFFIPIMLLMAITPFVSWRATGWRELGSRLFSVTCFSVGLSGVVQMLLMQESIGVHPVAGATVAGPFKTHAPLTLWMLLLIFLCVFVAVANVWRAVEIGKRSPGGVGGFVAHLGLATLMAGLVISRGYEQKELIFVRQDSPAIGAGYAVSYEKTSSTDLFDRDRKVEFDVKGIDGREHFTAFPGHYLYGDPNDPKDNVWPHVQRGLSHDVYLAMTAPEIKAWDQPETMTPGQTINFNGSTLQYVKPTMEGKAGAMGVTFGAELKLTTDGGDGERHQYEATPTLKVTEGGLEPTLPAIGPDYKVAIFTMNPSDKSVQAMLMFSPPIYPITVFYKPLTSLVWLGAGVMTLGGLVSALSRRRSLVAATKRGLA